MGNMCSVSSFAARMAVELALDAMSERDWDGWSYGIPQGSTTKKPRAKIESQSGKAK
jgi:hypothetical protein